MAHAAKAMSATAITAGTNQPATWSARRWIGARERWAAATMSTMRASTVSRPILSARITKPPDWLRVPPITRSPGCRLAGIDSPVTIDSSMVERPSTIAPSPGILSPDRDRVKRDVFVAAVRREAARCGRRETQEGADRARSTLARAQLQYLAEQHQHGDDRRGLEIDRNRAVVAAERRGKDVRRECGDQAVGVGHPGAECDQRE